MRRLRGWIRTLAVGRLRKLTLGWVALAWLARVVRRSRAAATDVPLSPVSASWYVGADFLERTGLVDHEAPAPVGELDDLGEFESDTFDPEAVQLSIRRFYEETADYEMDYRVTWSFGFRTGAALAGRLTSRIEQLNLPNWGSDWRPLDSRFVAVDVPGDPRAEVRGWVRTTTARGDATGGGTASVAAEADGAVAEADGAVAEAAGTADGDREAVFVALYGTHEAGAERLVNIAVPLPGGNLSTVLRARNADDGIEWTTAGGGDPGLYLVTPLGPFRLPMSQRFVVWDEYAETAHDGASGGASDGAGDGDSDRAADSDSTGDGDSDGAADSDSTGDGDSDGAADAEGGRSSSPTEPDLRARHEMEVFGRRFLTVEYRMERAAGE